MEDDFLSDFNISNEREGAKLHKISGGELEKFSKNVLDALIRDNVPPIPMNYQIYFQKLLDDPSITATFRKRLNEMMEFENKQDSKQIFIEGKVRKSFSSINVLLHDIAMIYKNTEVIKDLLEKRNGELAINSNTLAINTIITTLKTDFERYLSVLDRYSQAVKHGFEEVSHIYKSIEENSDFDQIFGVYNKNFLFTLIKRCKEGFEKYNYQNCIALFRVKDEILKTVESKDKIILLKTIAKILSKNIKKGDAIAHYQDGVFAMLLQHTNLNKARTMVEEVIEQIYNTNFFMSGTEIEMDLQAAMGTIQDEDIEKFITKLIKQLDKSGKNKENLAILEGSF